MCHTGAAVSFVLLAGLLLQHSDTLQLLGHEVDTGCYLGGHFCGVWGSNIAAAQAEAYTSVASGRHRLMQVTCVLDGCSEARLIDLCSPL